MAQPQINKISQIIPEASDLESTFKKNKLISMLLLILTASIDIVLLLFIIFSHSLLFYFLGFAAITLSLFSLKDDYIYYFKRKKIRLEKMEESRIGNYSTLEIRELVGQVLSHFKGREIPAIYIVDEPFGGAHVIDTYFFNFIGPINAIYLPKQYFYYLKPNELTAILAHELGHFYKYMYPSQRFPYPFYLLVSLVPAVLLPFINIWIVGLIYLGFHFGFYPLLHKLFNHKSKSLEYLSDHFAAELCGKLNVINGLMVSSKYSELLEVLHKKTLNLIKDDNELSINSFDDIFEKLVRILPDKPNSTDEVDKILSRAIQGFSFDPYKTQLTKAEVIKEKAIITNLLSSPELVKKRELLDWDTFDFVERNHRVEEEEYPALIKNISKGNLYLVDSVNDDEDAELNNTHPALRGRILFLDKNVKEMNTSILV